MRIVNQPLIVVEKVDGPQSFSRCGQEYPVAAVLERWADTGAWWQGESEKTFYRLLTGDGGLYELYQECYSGCWYLYAVYD